MFLLIWAHLERSVFFIFFSLKAIFESFFGYIGGPVRPPICAHCIHMDLDPLDLLYTCHIEAKNNSFHDF